ncbi:MAG: hypothetical protein H7831_15520 [Magnetococcus sp. WYHC-3]
MKIRIGDRVLENETECKRVPDGWEIFTDAIKTHDITPNEFDSADWTMHGSIIVED